MNTKTKQTVKFLDADCNAVTVTIEFRERESGLELSFTGETANSSGQITFRPATDSQAALLKLWDTYHLNGMSAGTPEQNKAIEGLKPYSYDAAVEILTKKNLLTVEHEGKPYTYGHGWIYKELPADIHSQVDALIEQIETEEEDRAGESLAGLNDEQLLKVIESNTDFSDRDAELAAAIVRLFDLSTNDLQDIEIKDTRVTVQGTDYLAGDDDEMDAEWEDSLDNYLDECVLPEAQGDLARYFDREAWKKDARMDGRAHSLNHYDGGEESNTVNGTEYFIYRQ